MGEEPTGRPFSGSGAFGGATPAVATGAARRLLLVAAGGGFERRLELWCVDVPAAVREVGNVRTVDVPTFPTSLTDWCRRRSPEA